MSIELKVKTKHLSVESQIIRFEERKLRRQIKWLRANQTPDYSLESKWNSLNSHRRWDVRNENRATFLARAYLEGKTYKSVEANRKPEKEYVFQQYILPRVAKLANKYGGNVTLDKIQSWVSA